MKKSKSSTELLIQGIKNLHPLYQGYLIDRLKHDAEQIREALPELYEKDKIDAANGKISMFHPNFFVTYVNDIAEIIDSIDRLYHEKYPSDKPFEPTPKFPYFD